MGITEDAANLNNAKTKCDEAISAVTGILNLQPNIGEAKHQIDEARTLVLMVAGETPGETIQAMLENLRIADEELAKLGAAINEAWTIRGALANCKDKIDEFIARLFS
jgi:hypothetical protein